MEIIRPYALELWSLNDRPVLSLKSAYNNFPGQAYGATLELTNDGTINFSCSIPIMFYDIKTGEINRNTIWFDDIKDKSNLTNFMKIKIIIYMNGLDNVPVIHEVVVTKVDEVRQNKSLICSISGTGLAFYELGKIGKTISINTDTIQAEVEQGIISLTNIYDDNNNLITAASKINLNYYLDKIFPNYYDAGLSKTIWLTPWQYEIRMNWSKYPDITTRLSTKCYEDPAPTSYELVSGQLQPKGYKFDEEKERFVEIANSNKYNITQDLAENFEVFVKYEYEYDYNTFEIISRKVVFYNDYVKKNLSENDNEISKFEINYGKNLDSISKSMDATETITKMYVKDIESQYSASGLISIVDATNNPTKDNFIIDFSYLKEQGIVTDDIIDLVEDYKLKLFSTNTEIQICLNNIDTYERIENSLNEQVGILQNQIDAATGVINDANEKMAATNVTGTGEQNPFPDAVIKLPDPKAYLFVGSIDLSYFSINLASNKGLVKSTLNAYTTFNGTSLGGQFITNGVVTSSSGGITILTDSYGFVTGIKNTNISGAKPVVNGLQLTTQKVWFTYSYNFINYYLAESTYYTTIRDTCTAKLSSIKTEDTSGKINYSNLPFIKAKIAGYEAELALLKDEKISLNDQFENTCGIWIKEGEFTDDQYSELGYPQQKTIITKTENTDIHNHNFSAYQNIPILFYDNILLTGEQENYLRNAETGVITKYYMRCALPATFYKWNFGDTQVEVVYTSGTKDLTYVLSPDAEYFSAYMLNVSAYDPILFFTDLKVPIGSYNTIKTITIYKTVNYVKQAGSGVVLYNVAVGADLLDIFYNPLTAYTIYYKRIVIPSTSINTDSMTISCPVNAELVELTKNKDYIYNYIGSFPTFTLKLSSLYSINDYTYSLGYKTVFSAEHLYVDALVIMEENKKPKVSYEVGMKNIPDLNLPEVDLGYVVYINDADMNFYGEMGIISSMSYNLDSPKDDSITISNYKTKFEDLFGKIVAASEQMKSSGYTYERAAAAILPTGEIDSRTLQNSITNQQLQMLYSNGSIVIDNNGITLYSKKA